MELFFRNISKKYFIYNNQNHKSGIQLGREPVPCLHAAYWDSQDNAQERSQQAPVHLEGWQQGFATDEENFWSDQL